MIGTSDSRSWRIPQPWPEMAQGVVYDLAQPLSHGIPHHPNHPPYSFVLTRAHGEYAYPDGVSTAGDAICLGGHVGTHVDALAHVSRNGAVYGDRDVIEHQSHAEGVAAGGVEELRPLLGRGVLMDAALAGGRILEPDDRIGAADFEQWFSTHPAPHPGDIVLIRTGWGRYWHDPRTFLGTAGAPGVTISGAQWLTDKRVGATGSDTIAYEKWPSPGLTVHAHLLVDHGVPILEALYLEELAAAERWEFWFVAVPLPLRGATGSPIRPLAIVPTAGTDA